MTKREVLNYIKDNLLTKIDDTDARESIAIYIAKEIAALDKRITRTKTYVAKKRAAANDPMIDAILNVLTNDFKTIPEITEAVDFEGKTPAKIQARLGKLYNTGKVQKANMNVSAPGTKKRVVVAYKAG